jgi:hypothetical protein
VFGSIAANLDITMNYDADLQQKISRFRLLAQIENGQLPLISTQLVLQRGETCHAQFPCALLEHRSVTKAVRYSGPAGSIRIMKGLRWRYGYVNVQPVTSEQLRELDSGTLYITNKRLLFNGRTKNSGLPLKRVVHFTTYQDGLRIEKDSGRDQIFKGPGDIELLGAILEAVLAGQAGTR